MVRQQQRVAVAALGRKGNKMRRKYAEGQNMRRALLSRAESDTFATGSWLTSDPAVWTSARNESPVLGDHARRFRVEA